MHYILPLPACLPLITSRLFSLIRRLEATHCSHLLLGAVLLPAEPTAANPPHAAVAVDSWDRQTDGRTPYRCANPAVYSPSMRVSN